MLSTGLHFVSVSTPAATNSWPNRAEGRQRAPYAVATLTNRERRRLFRSRQA